jgi:glycosyltransferase involved in cell wall biosynthesis
MTVIQEPRPVVSDPESEITSEAIELSIVMPCLNEAETVAACVQKARSFLVQHGISGEVIIADNGSTDGSQNLAAAQGARVIAVRDRGYGAALLGGFAASRGRFIIMGDADDSYDFTDLMPFVNELRNGADLVMGNRFRGGIREGAMPALHKYLGNPVLSGLGRLFFRSPVGDFHCGLRGFRRDAVKRMDLQTTGMELASEMVVKATLLGMSVSEVPTTLSPDGRSRPPHLRSWRDGWRHLRFMLLYSPRWLFFYPGVALMLLGLIVGVWLIPGPRQIGNVTLDIHTLLYAELAVLLGFQLILFAVFTKVFAISEGLLPEDPRMNRLFRYITLETGLVAGGLLTLAGIAGTFYAVFFWKERSFGDLEPTVTLRFIIPAVTDLAIGFQIIFASFFLSVLGMKRR